MEITRIEKERPLLPVKKRVAAYARVSSGKDAMLHSLAAQVAFYSGVIQRNAEWEYAGVYADEAYTGTKDSRPEFQKLLTACRNGQVDIILTKSLSRFARNTVTTLETVRELRELGVDVWFERENIHSLGTDGEFMITILASFAQEESLSASENQKWKIRKDFQEGIPNGITMLGYKLVNGEMTIVPKEAETVKMIFADYLSGMGTNKIVKKLTSLGIPTKRGCKWHENEIVKILCNEKYKGDMLLQKVFRVDHLTKKTVKNTGQLPQYYVEDSHEAIIDKETFEAVQEAMKTRSKKGPQSAPTAYPFSGKIICEKCGKHYRRKTTASGYRWICSTFNTMGKAFCDARQIPESTLTAIVGDKPFNEIHIPCDGVIRVLWKDGTESEYKWVNPSRSKSWTPEKRAKASERKRQCQRSQSQ